MLPTNGPAHAVVTSSSAEAGERRPGRRSPGAAGDEGRVAVGLAGGPHPLVGDGQAGRAERTHRCRDLAVGRVESAEEPALGEVGSASASRAVITLPTVHGVSRARSKISSLVRAAYHPRISSHTSSTRSARAARVR